jgi:hypothetical protein
MRRRGVCKKDCVNPLEWKRRMEGKDDEIWQRKDQVVNREEWI